MSQGFVRTRRKTGECEAGSRAHTLWKVNDQKYLERVEAHSLPRAAPDIQVAMVRRSKDDCKGARFFVVGEQSVVSN